MTPDDSARRFADPLLHDFHRDFVTLANDFSRHIQDDTAADREVASQVADIRVAVGQIMTEISGMPKKDDVWALRAEISSLRTSHEELTRHINEKLAPEVETLSKEKHAVTRMAQLMAWLASAAAAVLAGAWWVWQRIEDLMRQPPPPPPHLH